jgi:uncharacterized repeat protein (TIGR03803 family)
MFGRGIALAILAGLAGVARAGGYVTVVASFDGFNGAGASGNVVVDTNGNLYGAADGGGASGFGTVWEVAKGSSTITDLGSFNGNNGANPFGAVTMDAQGNLCGTTLFGGSSWIPGSYFSGYGTVWEIAKGSNTITTLASFNGCNGSRPGGSVTTDAQGNLYGAASYGGASWIPGSNSSGSGALWELAKGSNTITTLAPFNGSNGSNPSVATLDSQGNLYGTTSNGGSNGFGTVWELAKGSNTITTLASFNSVPNGYNLVSDVTLDANGDLYGTTVFGGANNQGAVWELAKGSNTITTLASFGGPNTGIPPGYSPDSGVTLDAHGNLYGTTYLGGLYLHGTVWELAEGSNTIIPIAYFDGTNGSNPYAGVTLGADGNLYGATSNGGPSGSYPGFGTVFEIAPPFTQALVPEPSSLIMGLISLVLVGGTLVLQGRLGSGSKRVRTISLNRGQEKGLSVSSNHSDPFLIPKSF